MTKLFFKRILPIVLSIIILVSGQTTFASTITKDELQSGYTAIKIRAKEYNIPFTMTFDEYVKAFEESGFLSTKEYADAYLGLLVPMESNTNSNIPTKAKGSKWYYNIGTSLPENANPVYDTYNLYQTVKKGDIIFEANGGFGITAHVAIVEGKFHDAAKGINYIRIIEAINDGVVRSCVDDTRVNDQAVTLLRVNSATESVIAAAVAFCVGELGSSYCLDFQKDTSSSETDWYCSELVWAAFMNQGINIEVAGLGEPGITPRDIKNSSLTTAINFK